MRFQYLADALILRMWRGARAGDFWWLSYRFRAVVVVVIVVVVVVYFICCLSVVL